MVRHLLSRNLAALCAIAGAAAAAGPGTACAQKPTVLFGVVTNLNGVRISGVALTIANSPLQVVTNDSGEFVFTAAPTGRVRLLARRLGFKPVEKGFKIDDGDSKQINFELEAIVEQLDSVLILGRSTAGRMADFWNRRLMGVGVFLTHDDIVRRAPYRPSDMLRTVAGVRVDTDLGDGRPTIRMGRSPMPTPRGKNSPVLAGDCKVTYYLDGQFVPGGTFHIDDMPTMSLEAIEVFRGPSETPAAMRQRETACGVISLWSREPPPRDKAKADTLRA